MTKSKQPELLDHIGWGLWRVTQLWKQRFTREMIKQGFDWYGEARGGLIQHIGNNGIAQIDLTERTGMTKQAVQQQLDDLCRDGIVERVTNSKDGRKKRIVFTAAGFDVLSVANEIKQTIEEDYRRQIGADDLITMKRCFNLLIENESKFNNTKN